MALSTIEYITNRYLYKQDDVINNRLDDEIILLKKYSIAVDKKEFMKGPGRFVNASDFSIVSAFFTQKNDIVAMNREEAILSNLAEGEYSKQEILKILGYIDSNGKGINGMFAGANKTLGFYDDGKDDLLERAYVWNSTSYKISDTARFIINKNGERRIEGFGIEPGRVDKSGEMIDDFDFVGGGWSNLVNPGLETVIDPSGIGKTVTITFTGKIDTYTLTSTAFEKEKDKKSYWSLFNGASNYIHLNRLINKLWDSGSIKHLYQGKPIIYGSADENGKGKNDVISGTKIIRKILGKEVTIDISNPKVEKGSLNLLGLSINGSGIIGGTSSASNFAKLDNPLSEYVKNGIAYVTGDGDDRITGTNNNDLFLGGDGNDILIGKGGDDELYGGRGNDVLYGDYATDSASSSSSSSTFSTGYTADNNRTFSTSSYSSSSSASSSSSSNESSNSSGNDILNGGAGNDILNGGKGYDTYYIGDNDVIIDSDGVGEIHFLRKDYQMKTAEDLKKENERGIHIPRFNPQGLPPGQVFTRLYDLHFNFGNGNPNGGTNKLFGFLEKVDDGNGSALFTLKDSAEKVIYYFDVEQPRMVDVKRIGKTAFKPYVSEFYWNGLQSRVMTAKRLTITEADTGHKVVINNFINGMLNIGLTDVEAYDGTYSIIYRNQARQNSGGGWGGNHQAGVRGQGTDMDSGSGNSSGNSSGSDNSTGTGNRNHGGNPDRSSPNPNQPSPNQGGRHYELYDPLVLDLDGDGLETLSADGHRGALFDHDGDGIRTATGWLKSDDGFLVYDRNNDGKINDLTELFSERFASNTPHGFAALSSLDSNHDGKVDALDEQFSRLKVWRDLNEDGQSSPEELFTLSQLNIRALYTHFEAQDQWQGGNHLTHLGQYETEEGHRHAMGDINFGYQPFYSQFIDKLTLTEEQKAAINLQGVGNVRDLREAATLSPKLAELLSRYRNVTTKAEQQALLPELIEAWAKTGKGYQTYGKALAKTTEYSLPTGGNGGHSDSLSTNDDIQILRVTPRELENIRQAKHDPAVMQRFEANKHKIATLNTLYHLNIQQLYYTTDGDIDYITDKVNRMYEQTLELAYRSLLSQTRLAPYFEHLTAVSQGPTPKTAEKLIALFDAKFKQSPEAALTDLAEFLSLLPQPRAWAEGLVLLQRYTAYAKAQGIYAAWQRDNQATLNVLTDIGFRFGSKGTDAADVFISHDESSTVKGEDGDDTFIGGKGNDVLDGSYGADTYIFAKGHGQDVISEYDTYQSGKQDTLRFTDVNYTDVRFRRENNDLILFGYHDDDRITIRNFYNNDYYQIENFQFADRTLSLDELKTIGIPLMGTDGDDEIQDWDSNAVIHGGDGNDRIYAHDGDDTLIGGKGNDVLDGSYGADTYIFAKGHGQDVISEYDTYQSGKQDTLRF
ncbi:calcium-binding protein, partial [uncultured Aggregatibacter sp.]|uniref:calcium-binding protein n=1 Tax=uncultured Aggregatibacter sp. TaxID=470564 RepID=UPI0025F291CE